MEFINVETTVFNIIGWALLLGSAATVVVPILVWIGNLICRGLWQFIDEGDTDYKDRFTSVYFAKEGYPEPEVVCEEGCWVVKVTGYRGQTESSMYMHVDMDRLAYERYSWTRFTSEGAAIKRLEENREFVEKAIRDTFRETTEVKDHMYLNVISVPVGLGFLFIPTITLVAGSALLSLYAMRWGRRGVKLAKKVKSSLDSHIADKDAHKE